MSTNYPKPIADLFTLGECQSPPWGTEKKVWRNYLAMGFGPEHVPDLERLAVDADILMDESDDPAGWAPMHAWRVLGQLKSLSSIAVLLDHCIVWENNDWLVNEARFVFAMMGPSAANVLINRLLDDGQPEEGRVLLSEYIEKVAQCYESIRDDCVQGLACQLKKYNNNSKNFNSSIISSLLELEAVEYTDLIKKVYDENRLYLSEPGDWEDAEIALGLRSKRSTPSPNYHMIGLQEMDEENGGAELPEQKTVPVATCTRTSPIIGHNEPCPCGSGEKYKKCCGGAAGTGSMVH